MVDAIIYTFNAVCITPPNSFIRQIVALIPHAHLHYFAMARRTKEEAQETRSTILDTAERIFSENGVAHTSLGDIASAAGVTRGAIYWHFKNKCELFTAMVDREMLPLDELLIASVDPSTPCPLGRLKRLIVNCLTDMVVNPRRRTILEILFLKWEHTSDMQPVIDRKQINIRNTIDRIRTALINAVNRHDLPAELDTYRAATFLHSLICGVMLEDLINPGMVDLRREAPGLVDGYFDMLRYSPALRLTPSES